MERTIHFKGQEEVSSDKRKVEVRKEGRKERSEERKKEEGRIFVLSIKNSRVHAGP